jgi:hypothetical protein
MKGDRQAPLFPAVDPRLSGHILHGPGPWGPGPLNVRGHTTDGRVYAALATPSGAIADKRAPWIAVPADFPALVALLRGRAPLTIGGVQ